MANNINYIGLTPEEVEASRLKWGANILTPAKKDSVWVLFLRKFKDPLILILLVAGLLSIGISCYEYYWHDSGAGVFFEPVGIFSAIIIATGLSFYFERRADKEFALLNQVNDDEPVKVIRGGSVTEVPRRDVVVDDIILLETGEEVPADAQLLEAVSLSVDESSLTGEPLCHKSTDPAEADPEATFPTDRVMRGTKVMEGHCVAKVLAVGDATENGKVFEAAQIDNSVVTPLEEQLDRLGKKIAKITYGIAALVIAGRVLMYFVGGGDISADWLGFVSYLLNTVMIAVALIVVAVPEGLPMAVTLSLAYSMRRMLKTNNLVRKMHACETMGAATVICTDKTGTLTQNKMQVAEAEFFALGGRSIGDDAESRLICDSLAVNSTAELDVTDPVSPKVIGNPTEGALLLWLNSLGVDYRKLRKEADVVESLPFSTERKYMATVIKTADGCRLLFVKGAPEIILGLCEKIEGGVTRGDIEARLSDYQSKAMRTLGFAYKKIGVGESDVLADGKVAGGLTFIGVAAISDPVRVDVPAAVKECTDAGIGVKIVTGDTVGTAREIGRQIGLYGPHDNDSAIITGPDFAALSDDELDERIAGLKIIARARPLDKKRLVETLQRHGEVVAVTGDGTNDAPALKAAQVGLSMGDGTSVAKEASDITIIDNSFASIGRAVMWGRSLYKNIQRFVLFQLTVNVVACLIVLFGAFMGTESPLTVTQMLWVNLIMDSFAAMGLASLPPSRGVMKDRPRDRRSFIIDWAMKWNIIVTGVIFFLVLLGILYVFDHSSISSLSELLHPSLGAYNGLSPYELSLFFTIFVMLQFWNLFNAKAFGGHRSAFHFAHCSEFIMVLLVIFVGQVVIVTFGGRFFGVVPLKLSDWVIIVLSTSIVMWVGELRRMLDR